MIPRELTTLDAFSALFGREPPPDLFVALTKDWLDFWQHAGALGLGGMAAVSFFYDSRRVQSLLFAELAHTFDRWMRSSAFLDLMQCNFRAMNRSVSLFPMFRLS